jgi:hypothetical protein
MTNKNKWIPGNKFWVALISGTITVASYYGNIPWVPPISAGLGTILVYLIPQDMSSGREALADNRN